MADPEIECGLTYDDDDFVDIFQSTFFDVNIRIDRTVEDYIERILDTLVEAIEEQFEGVEWRISTAPLQKVLLSPFNLFRESNFILCLIVVMNDDSSCFC
ncbi:hypothetical protein MA16_Dca017695 [Dendrobium catenatum]|uniref:Uncharacterized protein n=1 Tax=Dendrobium catenatum TaxID=906689 RepID=A0A2I0VW28_9ASPA|nr:hypothetical protein MA16_Dca017695 [Dendrobium catenatum]